MHKLQVNDKRMKKMKNFGTTPCYGEDKKV